MFDNEPILRVEAPLWQAQWVETYILNTINYQTLVATRAARMRDVAGEDAKLLEFGTRRAFSPQGALWAARAALAAGFDSTSNVAAALALGQKPSGTMAHSLVMAFEAIAGQEDDAFAAFGRYFPTAPLLIDTYDTVAAARRLANAVAAGERQVTGVRIDSGDIVQLSQQVRSYLQEAAIFASGDLDEWEIQRLLRENASVNGYGIGTRLVTGTPVNGVYKLVEVDGVATMKQSSSKETYPGRKQIFRRWDGTSGQIEGDRLGLIEESPEREEQSLMQPVLEQGQRLYPSESLSTIRDRVRTTLSQLPATARQLDDAQEIPVAISKPLQQLTRQVKERLARLG